MKIHKDEREWELVLRFSSSQCPHLYYPANYHGCRIRQEGAEKDDRCRLELCPFRNPANGKGDVLK